jgi:hemolysin D
VVRKILIQEGESVAQGQVLLQLEDTAIRAEHEQVLDEYWTITTMLARNRVLLEAIELADADITLELEIPESVPADTRQRQTEQLQAQYQAFLSNLEAREASLQESIYALEALRVESRKLRQQMPMIQHQVYSVKSLLEQELASEHEFMQQEQAWIDLLHQDEGLQQKIRAMEMKVQRLEKERDGFQQSFRNQLLAEKEKATRRLVELEQQRIRLESEQSLMTIRSPIDGRVERLSLHTRGGVVTPAQALMSIVPDTEQLLIEAYVQNKDIGFIHEDQAAVVKVDAYPFTRFGTLEGRVLSISGDAFNAQEQGWLFKTVIALPGSYLESQGRQFRLSPGMSAQVEIKTGKRKIINYFLSPLQTKIAESLNER